MFAGWLLPSMLVHGGVKKVMVMKAQLVRDGEDSLMIEIWLVYWCWLLRRCRLIGSLFRLIFCYGWINNHQVV